MSFTPKQSGLLKGGGVRRFKRRRSVAQQGLLKHGMPDVHLSDAKGIRERIWDFDPEWEFEYSQRELLLMAEKILLEDEKHYSQNPAWLPLKRMMERQKREIYVASGVPDPSIVSGYYWRAHPQGRSVIPPEQRRKNGSGFYR